MSDATADRVVRVSRCMGDARIVWQSGKIDTVENCNALAVEWLTAILVRGDITATAKISRKAFARTLFDTLE